MLTLQCPLLIISCLTVRLSTSFKEPLRLIHDLLLVFPGICYCRRGVEGLICERAESGRFFPALDFALVEAEGGAGNFTAVLPSEGHATAFTGSGYAQLSPGHTLCITNIRGPATFAYRLVMRYTLPEPCEASPHSKLTLEMHTDDPNSGFTAEVALDQLAREVGRAWLDPGCAFSCGTRRRGM